MESGDKLFRCNFCFGRFDTKENLPRTLPCQHTICETCLKGRISKDGIACQNSSCRKTLSPRQYDAKEYPLDYDSFRQMSLFEEHEDAIRSFLKLVPAKNRYVPLDVPFSLKESSWYSQLGLIGSPEVLVFLKSLDDTVAIVHFLYLEYDRKKVHRKAQISDNGELIFQSKDTIDIHSKTAFNRFEKFLGTTSTRPLSRSAFPQYFEISANAKLDGSLDVSKFLIDIGVCRRKDRDKQGTISDSQHCYSLLVGPCPEHHAICTEVWQEKQHIRHLCETIPNAGGIKAALHYGVLFDTGRKMITFFDVLKLETICIFHNVKCTEKMWPMFGVSGRYDTEVRMRLIVGNDIVITPDKRDMINGRLMGA